jgi:hypothetical protein
MSAYGNPELVTDGLILYLDAGNANSYPGSGTTWTDISGNGNTGTLVNGPTFNSANGGSIVFDGINDYVTIPYSSTLNTPSGATYEFWLKNDGTKTACFLNRGTADTGTNGDNPRIYHYNTNKLYIDWNTLAGSDRYADNVTYNELAFNNLVFIFSPAQPFVVYANSVALSVTMSGSASSDATLLNNNNPIILGGALWGAVPYYAGKIASVKLYNRALSSAEITQNFNALRGRYGL